MFPYSLGLLTALQGLYTLLLIVILLDVGSPTLDLRDANQWTGAQALPIFAALLTITFTVGMAMHTLSRNLFRRSKDLWDMEVLQIRARHLHQAIQVYRDPYRMARGFILPSLGMAIVLPFWEVLPVGHVGQFPLIGVQLFFLCVFFAGVAMYSFKERSYRYAAARLRSFLTLQAEARQRDHTAQPLQAVS